MCLFNEIGFDGLYNYIFVICVVFDEKVCYKGVMVVFNDEIYMVCNVIKIYMFNINIF